MIMSCSFENSNKHVLKLVIIENVTCEESDNIRKLKAFHQEHAGDCGNEESKMVVFAGNYIFLELSLPDCLI